MSCGERFQDARNYKITSLVDGSVLEMPWSNEENEIITDTCNGGSKNQQWLAIRTGDGYRLGSSIQEHETRCLDQDVANSRVILYKCHGGPNQQWIAEEVLPGTCVFFIICASNEKCLQNQGTGQAVTIASQETGNAWQYWSIKRTA